MHAAAACCLLLTHHLARAAYALALSHCQAAAEQRASVAVLRRLPEFGVSLLPAQLTQLPDKRVLLHRVLLGRHSGGSAGGGAAVLPWRRLGDVLELAALLGMDSEAEQQEVSGCMGSCCPVCACNKCRGSCAPACFCASAWQQCHHS